MTRDDIFDEDRSETQMYEDVLIDEEIELPLTKLGFEALLKRATEVYELPVDDAMRQVLAGYIHHIPNEQNTITIEKLSRVFYKSVANSTSWRIDQETKLKLKEEAQKLAEKIKDDNKVIPMKEDNGVQGSN